MPDEVQFMRCLHVIVLQKQWPAQTELIPAQASGHYWHLRKQSLQSFQCQTPFSQCLICSQMQAILEEANGNIYVQRFNKRDQSHNLFSSEQVNKVMHLVFLTYTNGNKYSETAQPPNPKPCQPSHHLMYHQFNTMQRNVSLNLESHYHFYTWDKLLISLSVSIMNVFLIENAALHT